MGLCGGKRGGVSRLFSERKHKTRKKRAFFLVSSPNQTDRQSETNVSLKVFNDIPVGEKKYKGSSPRGVRRHKNENQEHNTSRRLESLIRCFVEWSGVGAQEARADDALSVSDSPISRTLHLGFWPV